jgi:hypothetical protein
MKGLFSRYGLVIGFLFVFLVSVLTNFAFNFNIPARFFNVVAVFSVGICLLIVAVLLKLRKVAPGEGWGYSPLGLFLIGISILSWGLGIGLEDSLYGYGDQLSIVVPPWMLAWGNPLPLLFWVGAWVEYRTRKRAEREQTKVYLDSLDTE